MVKIKNPRKILALILFLPLPVITVSLGLWVKQANSQTSTLFAAHDTFVDPNNPTIAFNAQRLELTYSNFPAFGATRYALLQFNLIGTAAVVNQSRLVLNLVENNLPPGAAVSDDTWTATASTYNILLEDCEKEKQVDQGKGGLDHA